MTLAQRAEHSFCLTCLRYSAPGLPGVMAHEYPFAARLGRCRIGALSRDRVLLVKSGRFHTSAELAGEYGIVDIDGKRIKEERLAM